MFVLKPGWEDLQVVAYYVGKVLQGLGLVMLVPAVVGLALGEWDAASALGIGAALTVAAGRGAEIRLRTTRPLVWSHGLATVGLAWLVAPLLAAVPLYLSGHYGGYLDAYFDGMSGLTATGMTLVQDVDHMPIAMNLWRHTMHFLGGQGIIIVVLSLLAGGGAQVGTMYFGEGRGERVLPSVIRTARFIFVVAFVYAALGVSVLWLSGLVAGMTPGRSLFHALTLFMTAFDTGGFAPMSTSAAYYHSFAYEVVLVVLMVAGALSFFVHYQLWHGDRRELYRSLEVRALGLTLLGITTLALVGLVRSDALTGTGPLFRRGVFTMVSAHTTTGLTFEPPALFVSDWGVLAPAAIVMGMAIGGMASSTAGGVKAIRLGIAAKGLWRDVRRVLLPESALVVSTYHSGRRRILRDEEIRGAVVILLLYLLTFIGGSMVMLAYGRWDFTEALFDATSVASNGGLSVGVITPDAPAPIKALGIVWMWFGRLEFMTAFAFLGYVLAIVRGRT
jgi:trk system potassium uptake protein